MELNEETFQLLQHGKLPDLKQPYILPSGETLKGSDHVKDLGVYIDLDLNWRTHIAMKSAKARNMASWVLRTFISRDVATMMLLYKYSPTYDLIWNTAVLCGLLTCSAKLLNSKQFNDPSLLKSRVLEISTTGNASVACLCTPFKGGVRDTLSS